MGLEGQDTPLVEVFPYNQGGANIIRILPVTVTGNKNERLMSKIEQLKWWRHGSVESKSYNFVVIFSIVSLLESL